MNRAEWSEFINKLAKSRIVLYGLIVGLFILILVLINHLINSPAKITMASSKPGKIPDLIPLEKAEQLMTSSLIVYPKTNILSPFYTDRFKVQQAPPTNAPPPPPPPPKPTFYTLNIKYLGLIENSSGFKKAFFMVNSNLVVATNSMAISTNITVVDFSQKEALLKCPNGTNALPFNKDCQLQLPIK